MTDNLTELCSRFPAIEWHADETGRGFWADVGVQTITVELVGMSWRARAWGMVASSLECPADAVEYLIDTVKGSAGEMMEWAISAGRRA